MIELKATHTLANFVRELKKASSMWVHEAIPLRAFAWQEGYAAFTVSASGVDEVGDILKIRKSIIDPEVFARS